MGRTRCWTTLALGLALYGCASHKATAPAYSPPGAVQGSTLGVASWYGPGFHGRRTANGEIYNQEDLTAASPNLPLGTMVAVTNLNNGRSVVVRINDRGPYVKGRRIDLSHRAASALGMIDPGTAPVRIDVLSVRSRRPFASTRYRYYVQVGLFTNRAAAQRLRDSLAPTYPDVAIDHIKAGRRRYYCVRMGGFATRYEAMSRAHRSVGLRLPIIVGRE